MAPRYTFNYFDVAGRGEPVRLMFHAAGVEFTDNRLGPDEWKKYKSDTRRFPLGQMPTLEVDDKVICQSLAIFRFVARETGHYGNNAMEQALIDQVCETLIEIGNVVIPIIFGGLDEETKKKKWDEFFASEKLKSQFTFLNNLLKKNNGGAGFFVGNKVSLADIFFHSNHGFLTPVKPTYLDDFPQLKAVLGCVENVAGIKKYMDSRKK